MLFEDQSDDFYVFIYPDCEFELVECLQSSLWLAQLRFLDTKKLLDFSNWLVDEKVRIGPFQQNSSRAVDAFLKGRKDLYYEATQRSIFNPKRLNYQLYWLFDKKPFAIDSL